ncbi:MAG: hypothetical protein ACLUHN_03625 [Evtepia gabavorous]
MSRLRITPWENSQRTVDDLYADTERRISAAPAETVQRAHQRL